MLVTLRRGEDALVVSTIGATVLEWSSGGVSLIDGYLDEAELRTLDGYRSAVLAPWSNRVRDGKWDDAGAIRSLADAGNVDPEGLHGLVFDRDFDVIDQSATLVVFRTVIDATDGYPYELTVDVSFDLSERGLAVSISARNDSDHAAPVGLGWHPYFFRSAQPDEYAIVGSHYVDVDEQLIPTSDPFVTFEGFGDTIPDSWDNAITGVRRDVTFPVREGSVTMSANFDTDPLGIGIWHVFSGWALNRGKLESVAVEPCTAMGDALNRLRDQMLVEPGATKILKIDVSYSPQP